MKQETLEMIKTAIARPVKGRNSMGCSESNYNPYYAIGRCFTEEELNNMDEAGLNNLIKLGQYLSDAFY
jgi:hypothetical protein